MTHLKTPPTSAESRRFWLFRLGLQMILNGAGRFGLAQENAAQTVTRSMIRMLYSKRISGYDRFAVPRRKHTGGLKTKSTQAPLFGRSN